MNPQTLANFVGNDPVKARFAHQALEAYAHTMLKHEAQIRADMAHSEISAEAWLNAARDYIALTNDDSALN